MRDIPKNIIAISSLINFTGKKANRTPFDPVIDTDLAKMAAIYYDIDQEYTPAHPAMRTWKTYMDILKKIKVARKPTKKQMEISELAN